MPPFAFKNGLSRYVESCYESLAQWDFIFVLASLSYPFLSISVFNDRAEAELER